MSNASRLLLAVVLLATPALACTVLKSATPIPTATQAPPTAPPLATSTPDLLASFTTYENTDLGLTFAYPQQWAFSEEGNVVTVASSAALLTSPDFDRAGAGVRFVVSSQTDFPSGSVETALQEEIAALDLAAEGRILDGPRVTVVNGQEAALATVVEGDAADKGLLFFMTLIRSEGRAVLASGATLASSRQQYEPVLTAIADSLILHPPSGPVIEGNIEMGETVRGEVPFSGAAAWRFDGQEGELVDVRVTPLAEALDVTVDLVDSSGASVLPGGVLDDAYGVEAVRALPLPADDDYLIVVAGFAGSSGIYEVTLAEGGALSELAAIQLGERVAGSLEADQVNDYRFSQPEAGTVLITVEPEDDLDVVVEIVDAQGQRIVEEDESFGREVVQFSPVAGVEYLIRVRGFAGGSGSYEVGVTAAGQQEALRPVLGESYQAFLNEEETHTYLLDEMAGMPVDLVVRPVNSLDIVLELYDEEGELLQSQDEGFEGEEESLFFSPDGGTLSISGYGGSAGSYTIIFSSADAGAQTAGTSIVITDTLPAAAERIYPFYADSGDLLQAALQADSDADLRLELWDNDAQELLEEADKASEGEGSLSLSVSVSGNYYVRVINRAEAPIDYLVTLHGSPSVIFELLYWDRVQSILGEAGFIEYAIRLDPLESAVLSVAGDEQLDAVIEVYDLDGTLLVEADQGQRGEPEKVRFTAPAAVEENTPFIIRIRDYENNPGGSFELTIQPAL